MKPLTAATLPVELDRLCEQSCLIANIRRTYGDPPLWRREPGFSSLAYTILEQQVSLASAKATYDKLLRAVDRLTPESFLRLTPEVLRAIGFSRQKIEYCTLLAHAIIRRDLDLDALGRESDETIRDVLMSLKGIGQWTADIYLLHSLGRPDVWPVGDLALQIAAQEILNLDERPRGQKLAEIGHPFAPLRSVAARVFWQAYLAKRGITEVS